MHIKLISIIGLSGIVLMTSSCSPSKPTETASKPSETPSKPSETITVAAGMKQCFQCNGKGVFACAAPGCKSGVVDCPGPCLKLSQGKWEHMQVEGHSPNDLWQR